MFENVTPAKFISVPVEYLSIDLREEQQSLSLILQPALEALITAVSSGA